MHIALTVGLQFLKSQHFKAVCVYHLCWPTISPWHVNNIVAAKDAYSVFWPLLLIDRCNVYVTAQFVILPQPGPCWCDIIAQLLSRSTVVLLT